MKILLVVANDHSTFTKIDQNILEQQYEVRDLIFRRKSLFEFFRSMLDSISAVIWADVILAWFGSFHALVPFLLGRVLRKQCVVVASGYDVAAVPEIDYGNMRPGLRRWIGLTVFRLSHLVLAVSQKAYDAARQNAKVPESKLRLIYHGIPVPDSLKAVDFSAKTAQVLTLCFVKHANIKCKGLLTFIEAARSIPDVPFILAGTWVDDSIEILRSIAPANVQFTGTIDGEEKFKLMRSTAVYVQLSTYESFGMALAEAMLAGCIPVATPNAALPEVVGDTGYYAEYGDVQATVDAIRAALTSDFAKGVSARERILQEFSLERRSGALLRALDELNLDQS